MSVVIETTLGDMTVDLYLKQRPVTCLNFLKLCKMKYYNYNLFHSIRSGFIAQTGDPTGEGSGGQSIFGVLEGPERRFFSGEKMPKIRHTDTGLLSMVCTGDMMVGSQFFFTLAPDLDSLDGVHCVIGEVTEGHDVLRKLNDVICDDTHRPYRDVRITHTVILEDPFNDPVGFIAPSRSPSPNAERLVGGRIAPDEEIDETQGKSAAEVHEMIEEKEAKARATILEIIGDLPDANIAPPENVLFVCKLNPVTTDEDLEIIFSRFGKIVSCEVIRDKKTGDSLQYAFVEFSDKKSCEDAYFKMDNVLIDDRRIHVDFSQSVSKMKWLGKGRGVKHFSDDDIKSRINSHTDHSNLALNKDREHKNGKDFEKTRENNDKEKYDDKRHRERQHDRYKRSEKITHERKRSRSRSKIDSQKTKYDNHDPHKDTKNSNSITKHGSQKEDNNSNRDYSHNFNHSPERTKNQKLKYYKDREISKDCLYDNNTRNVERKECNDDRKSHRSVRKIENNTNIMNSKKEKLRKEYRYTKQSHVTEPRTPSPILGKKKKHSINYVNKQNRDGKKKHKKTASTSTSDSDSTKTSSSSSESTSSSERNKKKKILKRKKRKNSSSSSSSTSSSDSTSSSSTSTSSTSSSTSSDSNTDKRKRRKKVTSKEKRNKHKKPKKQKSRL